MKILRRTFLVLSPIWFLAGCGEPGAIKITEVREIDPDFEFERPALAESDASRFRYRVRSDEEASPAETTATQLTWETPEGWKQFPTSSMREANLRFGPNNEGECYVTRLSGMGGGLTPNVNRWREQMGAEPLSDEEVAALPKKSLFGQPATLVSVDGTYTGVAGGGKEDSRLHGLILYINGAMVTVKMTGPRELVMENEARFDAFCASLDVRSSSSSSSY